MSRRNSIGRIVAARLDSIRGFTGALAAGGPVLSALGTACLMDERTVTVSSAITLAFGGLLLVGAVAGKRSSQQPSRGLVELRRGCVHPMPHRFHR